jgi:hypothetical protein
MSYETRSRNQLEVKTYFLLDNPLSSEFQLRFERHFQEALAIRSFRWVILVHILMSDVANGLSCLKVSTPDLVRCLVRPDILNWSGGLAE